MAKKDNFDFETESKSKFNLNFDFIKNLSKQQKGIILIAAVAIILVIAIIIICTIIGANEGFDNNGGNSGFNPENGEEDIPSDDIPDEISDFYISAPPAKTTYYVGDIADFSGLSLYYKSQETSSVFINYEPGLEGIVITGFDSSIPDDEQVITVECRGLTDTFTIRILEVPISTPTLVGIHLDPNNMPVDTCRWGYAPDIRGAKLVCEYSDGTTKVVSLEYENLNEYEEDLMAAQVGDTVTIEVIYDENGYVAVTSFTIIIIE